MTGLADSIDRRRALTALDQTLLVEAAAGTGKTSLLAGRVTMLLASGVHLPTTNCSTLPRTFRGVAMTLGLMV
ncbi:hypothetical protein EOA27_01810 [Mesorhizobium sp. M2A.F.Ca.ET.037.01.1.1]|uniref:UvrD-helicase domain-containing protein n=1 Tax=unclassified Mesorhizobium TaxID=325217 RepID=UPI000FCB1F1A|nr:MULTISPECIES: UvrD-helicase domain-containing protein [unclassified Mesorhizobium]RUX23026.1 hypothetical protein EOA27_01810 [Mesorhizobium sp. M2A.F.Ca.ET.037.01.1.1]RUY09964.1 hypothetical protein EOA25_09905 [Mesorhizobium sp. M2A.F.Ca.ET.040.01.1.1]RWA91612.1 MAG: hypothetical protein EOQ31_10880 [Mesorhizobium sp.]TIV13785.1 MAG: hypothetical protein E5V95_32895 [Mesorhizobium sp.]